MSVFLLNVTVFKARQRMRCPRCIHRGETARCFNGAKFTHVERLRAAPSPHLCIGLNRPPRAALLPALLTAHSPPKSRAKTGQGKKPPKS